MKNISIATYREIKVLENTDKLVRCKEYSQQLFDDGRCDNVVKLNATDGPSITKDETRNAIRKLKANKEPGTGDIHGDVLKMREESNLNFITELFNDIYETAVIPYEWLMSVFIPFPRKACAKTCAECRTISLTSHMLKVFFRIIRERIYPKLERNITVAIWIQ